MSRFKNSLNGIFPGLALLSQREQLQAPELSRAEQPLTDRQQRLLGVATEALQAAQNGGVALPIPTAMVGQLIEKVIRNLTDEQIEEYAVDLVVKVEWVLNGEN